MKRFWTSCCPKIECFWVLLLETTILVRCTNSVLFCLNFRIRNIRWVQSLLSRQCLSSKQARTSLNLCYCSKLHWCSLSFILFIILKSFQTCFLSFWLLFFGIEKNLCLIEIRFPRIISHSDRSLPSVFGSTPKCSEQNHRGNQRSVCNRWWNYVWIAR